VTVLLLASIDSRTEALLALGIFAVGTAASMAALSLSLGFALGRGPLRTGLNRLAPALGTASFAFGAWYALGALAL
jgi:hypothetical protein